MNLVVILVAAGAVVCFTGLALVCLMDFLAA